MNKKMNLQFNDLYVDQINNKIDFSKFFGYLRQIAKDTTEPQLTTDEMNYILKFTTKKIVESDKESDYSRRIIIRMFSYFKHVKKLFGDINSVLDYIEPFAGSYIINERSPTLIENILGDENIEKPELVRKISKLGGYTSQHARRIINKELEEGKIGLKGKFVFMRYR
jgi:hypothetical protein